MSNGEYDSLRVKGYRRPVSVLQIKANSRAKYANCGQKNMLAMLTPTSTLLYLIHNYDYTHNHNNFSGGAGGSIVAVKSNPAVTL